MLNKCIRCYLIIIISKAPAKNTILDNVNYNKQTLIQAGHDAQRTSLVKIVNELQNREASEKRLLNMKYKQVYTQSFHFTLNKKHFCTL